MLQAYSESRKAYSESQIGVEMGFGAQWGKNSATASLNVNSTSSSTTTYQAFKQIYYSVVIEEPGPAGSVFTASVTLTSANMSASHPPGFVRSVDYGRLIIVQMTTNQQLTKQDAEGALSFTTAGGVTIDSELKQRYENITKNSTFKAFAIGGGVGQGMSLVDLFTGNATAIRGVIETGLEFSEASPGVPIAYTVADLKTRRVAAMRTTTKYVEQTCQTLADRSVKLMQRGGYVAKFIVDWDERDGAGWSHKAWDSGKKTNPWDHTIFFPGDAKNFRIRGINDTGLLWDKHRTVEWRFAVLTKNECLKIYGTTLNMAKGSC